MALTYDFTNIEDYQNKCLVKLTKKDKDFDPNQELYKNTDLANTLIWSCLFIGISEITNKNYKQFYWRLKLLDVTQEELRGNKKKFVSLDEVKSMIGLKTNATEITKAEFYKKRIKHLI